MATIPTVQVWSTGQFVTSSQMNAGVGNVLSWLMSTPRAIVYRNASLSISSTSVTTVVNQTTELVDTDTMWSNSQPSRLTAHTAGLFLIEAAAHFTAFSSGQAMCGVGLNTAGSWAVPNKLQEVTMSATGPNFGESCGLTFSYFLNSGDYLEQFVAQTSGGSLSVFPGGTYFDGHFGAKWIATS